MSYIPEKHCWLILSASLQQLLADRFTNNRIDYDSCENVIHQSILLGGVPGHMSGLELSYTDNNCKIEYILFGFNSNGDMAVMLNCSLFITNSFVDIQQPKNDSQHGICVQRTGKPKR